MAELLDTLSGFEFEDLMEDVFRNLGYENVRQSRRTADEGRDILMEEMVDGTRRAVIVECKHTDSVSRPVVQKLHSAVATFDFDGPKRGIVVTTGRFTKPAREYARKLTAHGQPNPIDLIDGTDLRDISEEVGLDLRNGRIEILCNETLRPIDPTSGRDAPVYEAFQSVENIDTASIPQPQSTVRFRPMLTVSAHTAATFETSVGVIHRLNESDTFLVHADRGHPRIASNELACLIGQNTQTVELDDAEMNTVFDSASVDRFGQTETAYKEWAIDQLQQRHTTTVRYTGGNNVDYEKTCTPALSDISIRDIDPVYLPQITSTVTMGDYSYSHEYFAAGPSRATITDEINQCVHCGTSTATSYTYCANCGSINCGSHIKTERLEGEPVCTGCAVTERFAFRTKYFYNEENLSAFREEYDQMPIHRKAGENVPLVVGTLLILLVLGVVTLMQLSLI